MDLRHDALAASLGAALGWPRVACELHSFPDGETYLRVLSEVDGGDVTVLADLARPDARLLALLFAGSTLREQGARRLTLVAPYLPYMRQDKAFHPGECVSSRHFAALLDACFDELLTVDAHLHRYPTLAALYRMPARNLAAAALLASWVREHVRDPLLIGPDAESAQWTSAAASAAGCPWTTLEKTRTGERRVRIHGRIDPAHVHRTPVLVDDMISTGSTLIEACGLVRATGMAAPIVLAVHGIFAGDACEALAAAGAADIVTTNSIPHASNAIDLAPLLAAALASS